MESPYPNHRSTLAIGYYTLSRKDKYVRFRELFEVIQLFVDQSG